MFGYRICCGLLIAGVAFLGGCGGGTRSPSPAVPPAVAANPWPSEADYGTIKTALAARDDALFHEPNWRRKSFVAELASRTLLTVRMTAGSCAAYVTELYGTLHDLMEAYPGEDWRPLLRFVRRQPSLHTACTPPANHRQAYAA
jgi:hypothetical protein